MKIRPNQIIPKIGLKYYYIEWPEQIYEIYDICDDSCDGRLWQNIFSKLLSNGNNIKESLEDDYWKELTKTKQIKTLK